MIKMSVKPIPDGYHTATPYLVVEGASMLIDFPKAGFQGDRNISPDPSRWEN